MKKMLETVFIISHLGNNKKIPIWDVVIAFGNSKIPILSVPSTQLEKR